MSNRVVQQLHLKKNSEETSLTDIHGFHNHNSHSTTVVVRPVDDNELSYSLAAHVMPRVTCDLPLHQATGVRQLPHISGLKLADPRFDKPGRIDTLTGGKHLRKMILPQRLMVENSDIVAFNTVFGWAIMGAYPMETSLPSSTTASISHAVSLPSMDASSGTQRKSQLHHATNPEERSALEHLILPILLPEGRFQAVT